MIDTFICEKTIAHGQQRYRIDINDNWKIQMFGTFSPSDNGIPRYGWVAIPEDKVPVQVKSKV